MEPEGEEGGGGTTTTRRKGGQAVAATKQWNRRSGGRGEAPINPGDLVKRESTWKEITSEKHLLVYKKIYDEKLYTFVYCVYELESGKVYESLLIDGGGLTHIKI